MTRSIYTSKGEEILVDDDDYEGLARYTWWITVHGYVNTKKRKKGKQHNYYMHRMIMSPPVDLEVDHINGNKADNRRANLRIVTHAQNKQNQHRAQSNSRSGVRGAFWDKARREYRVEIRIDGKKIVIGYFKTLEEADTAAKAARREYMTHSPECMEEE